jgi:sec-independent protein translocase protein TatB
MPQIGPMEILVVGVIALIVFGPQKLPEIARSVGRAASELRRMATDVRDEFEAGINLEDKEERKERRGGRTDRKDSDRAHKAEDSGPDPEAAQGSGPDPTPDVGPTSSAPQTNKVVGRATDDDEGSSEG